MSRDYLHEALQQVKILHKYSVHCTSFSSRMALFIPNVRRVYSSGLPWTGMDRNLRHGLYSQVMTGNALVNVATTLQCLSDLRAVLS